MIDTQSNRMRWRIVIAGVAWIAGLLAGADRTAVVAFEEIAARAGLHFILRNSATGEKHQIETMPGGVAALDYDRDGWLDVFFTNGAGQPRLEKSGPAYHNRLFRNRGDGRFEDVTARAGLQGTGYDMGVAAADYDNDGFPDLFVAGVNGNRLYRNRGNGSFEDATARAGMLRAGPPAWSIAAGWFDYDRDGRLDLFVVRYVVWDPAREPFCGAADRSYHTYCHPKFYAGLPNQLWRNNGDGTFTDVSAASGIGAYTGKGMGVAFADYDQDGDTDVFVANDTVPNFLFRNLFGNGGGRFVEVASEAGVAYNDDGRALSSMGVDFRDADNDGREDLFVTALVHETFPLFRNLGRGLFEDRTYPSRIGRATMQWSGWGTGLYDFNNDGVKDIFCANGDVNDNAEVYSSRRSRQPNGVLVAGEGGVYSPLAVGPAGLHRGAAFGDFDNDGRIDVVVTRLNEPALLLRNVTTGGGRWLRLRLEGRRGNRDGLGARVRLVSASGRRQWNQATTSVGYASSSESIIHFGLGAQTGVREVEIRWPSGAVQKLENPPAGRLITVREP